MAGCSQQDTRVPVSKYNQGPRDTRLHSKFIVVRAAEVLCSHWPSKFEDSPLTLKSLNAHAPRNFIGENFILPLLNRPRFCAIHPTYFWTQIISFGEISDCTGICGHPHGIVEVVALLVQGNWTTKASRRKRPRPGRPVVFQMRPGQETVIHNF